MLELSYIRQNKEKVIDKLRKRGKEWSELADKEVESVLTIDDEWRHAKQQIEEFEAQRNSINKEIGTLMREGKREEAESMKQKSSAIKDSIKSLEDGYKNLEASLNEKLLNIPNIPNDLVVYGNGENDNEEIRRGGEMIELAENASPHWDIAEKYDLIKFDLGVKIAGAGFPVYKGKGAQLQRGLINFFLSENTRAGYEEYQPPLFVNEESGYGTGQLPDKEGQMYHMRDDNLYAIPTSEVPLTNIYRDEIVDKDSMPIRCTAYTPCFRREAGSYGKDVRGLNRLHQFDKVEIVNISHPDQSYEILDEMVAHVEGLLRKLELPYRILRLCGGDLGFTSALTYDFEVWSAAQKRWLEVSSVSNFETYQSNRLKLRYRGEDGKTHLCHTLNGSSLALPRIVAALLENHQTEEGVSIPKALQPFTGFEKID